MYDPVREAIKDKTPAENRRGICPQQDKWIILDLAWSGLEVLKRAQSRYIELITFQLKETWK